MFEEVYYGDISSWDEVYSKTVKLPKRLFRMVEQRILGLPVGKIADRLNISYRSAVQYNSDLNVVYNIDGKSETEQDFFYALVVRPVVEHIQQNPYILEQIERNPDYVVTPRTSATGPTWKLPKFIGTDPNDTKHIYNFTRYIVLFVFVLIIIVFTLLAVALGAFTLSPTPFIYIGI